MGYGPISGELVEVGRHSASLMYRLTALAARLDDSDEWRSPGQPTAAHWIADALDVEVCTAREWIRVGKALARLPQLHDLFESQQLSYSKVRTLSRFATADNCEELCEIAAGVPAGRLNVALAEWSARYEDPDERNKRHQRERYVTWRTEPDGMVTGSFKLPPLEGGRLAAAIDAMVSKRAATPRDIDASADASGPYLSLGQQRADSLLALVAHGGAQVLTELVIHVRADGCSFDDGTPLENSIVERIAPTSFVRALIHDADSHPINASGKHRHPTERQKRLVSARDRVCVDCGSREFLQYDHVPDYRKSKRTVVDELELRCSRCHRRRHRHDGGKDAA